LLENRAKPDEVQQAVVVPQPAPSLSFEPAPYTAPLTPAQKIGVIYSAMRTQGESPRLLTELGKAFQQVGDLGGALDALTKARALAPYDANIAFNLATLYRDRKDLNSAREMMAEYMRLETDLNDLAQIRANPNFRDLI
jgi:cytochrome c-type biogenesis protein CcmH/NrfG